MAAYTESVTEPMVFRKTNTQLGRHLSVTPANSANRHLAYGRIILKDQLKVEAFSTANRETGLIVLAGAARVDVNGRKFELGQYDALYIPRDSALDISTDSHVDIAEFSADVEEHYPLQHVRYADVIKDPTLRFSPDKAAQKRTVNILIGSNVEAGRVLAGFTVSEPGNWTSWPPHEHTAMLEEMYVYFDMPEPAFGLQLVYNNTEYPELVTVVRDGDAVLMPSGYHPNVSVPGHRITFLWAMAAHREKLDRQYGVVNVQPAFSAGGSGLEASRK